MRVSLPVFAYRTLEIPYLGQPNSDTAPRDRPSIVISGEVRSCSGTGRSLIRAPSHLQLMSNTRYWILYVDLGQIDTIVLRIPGELLDECQLESCHGKIATIRKDELLDLGLVLQEQRQLFASLWRGIR